MEKKKQKLSKEVNEIIKNFKSRSDPMGGYTGNPLDGDKPVQDADDL